MVEVTEEGTRASAATVAVVNILPVPIDSKLLFSFLAKTVNFEVLIFVCFANVSCHTRTFLRVCNNESFRGKNSAIFFFSELRKQKP